jgi:hypothetical protein
MKYLKIPIDLSVSRGMTLLTTTTTVTINSIYITVDWIFTSTVAKICITGQCPITFSTWKRNVSASWMCLFDKIVHIQHSYTKHTKLFVHAIDLSTSTISTSHAGYGYGWMGFWVQKAFQITFWLLLYRTQTPQDMTLSFTWWFVFFTALYLSKSMNFSQKSPSKVSAKLKVLKVFPFFLWLFMCLLAKSVSKTHTRGFYVFIKRVDLLLVYTVGSLAIPWVCTCMHRSV